MKYDLGFVRKHPLLLAVDEFMCVIRTWLNCRKGGVTPTEWWGVYEKGTERPVAKFGPGILGEQRARDYIRFLEQQP